MKTVRFFCSGRSMCRSRGVHAASPYACKTCAVSITCLAIHCSTMCLHTEHANLSSSILFHNRGRVRFRLSFKTTLPRHEGNVSVLQLSSARFRNVTLCDLYK